jgi:methionyl-tRNA synthetase
VSEKVFYITTPIYYVNDVPHIGHAYSTIGADVRARFERLRGKEVFFLTGTDEHGQKIEKSSAEKGYASPQALADAVVVRFQELWKKLDISNDDFIRTTQERHKQGVKRFFETVYKNGYIEKKLYQGWYCVHEETFWTPSQLVDDNLCPQCQRPCQPSSEENYFFKQSVFKQALKEHIAKHPDFVEPLNRRNEILGSYLEAEDGVNDISITRANLSWGIPSPGDEKQVIYVWFDALLNYLTGAGYGWDDEKFNRIWPADLHLIGKDILRFHALLWPNMLMAAKIKLPAKVFGTGFIMQQGQKMSKSLGNVVDPMLWADQYGVDVLRYYLMREVPFGQDGTISEESILTRYDKELANDWGNLLSRTVSMIGKYNQGLIPADDLNSRAGDELCLSAGELWNVYSQAMVQMRYYQALESVMSLVRKANQYVDKQAPWKLAKDPSAKIQLNNCLYRLAETLRLAALCLQPFMPSKAAASLQQLGLEPKEIFSANSQAIGQGLESLCCFGILKPQIMVMKGEPLFPRKEKIT